MRLIRKITTIVIIITAVAFSSIRIMAEDATSAVPGIGEANPTKTSEETPNRGEYVITINVPGNEAISQATVQPYNEVISMLDGSVSQDQNFDYYKNIMLEVGKSILTDDRRVKFTVMGFGYSPNTVFSAFTVSELESILSTLERDDLLYGVSATNCEASFVWMDKYIADSNLLNEAVVMYLSDGETNLDEEPVNWSDWQNHSEWWYRNNWTAAAYAQLGADTQKEAVLNQNGELLDVTKRMFPELSAAFEADKSEENINAICSAIIADDETAANWINGLFNDIWTADGLDYSKTATASQTEYAVWRYARNLGHGYEARSGGVADLYLLIYYRLGTKMTDYYAGSGNNEFGSRAADACDKLCENPKLKNIYMIGFKQHAGKEPVTHWMNPDSEVDARIRSEKAVFVEGGSSFTDAFKAMQLQIDEVVAHTPIVNPIVVDPMSKWVTFDTDSFNSLYIEYDGEKVWTYTDGWLIDITDSPFYENPVTIEKNENDRWQITWFIKKGPLTITDRFALKYTVTINTEAEGYEADTDYPLNDETWFKYTDNNGVPHSDEIKEPVGSGPRNSNPDSGDHSDIWYIAATVSALMLASAVALKRRED